MTDVYGMDDGFNGAVNWRIPPSGRYRREQGDTMKRFKRNRIQRAFEKGYQLGLSGRSRENCPFLTGLARSKWLEGWREGRNDWREGLTDALTCYKLSGFWSLAWAHAS
jgi:ribosome modulation factor